MFALAITDYGPRKIRPEEDATICWHGSPIYPRLFTIIKLIESMWKDSERTEQEMLSLRMVCSKSINRFTMVLLVYNGIRYIKQRSQGQFRMAKNKN